MRRTKMNQNEMNTQQEEMNTQQNENGKPEKKKVGGSTVAATVASIAVVRLFGLLGGLICFGGYWAVYGIAKSRLPVAARVILCLIVALAFIVLLLAFILLSSAIVSSN